MCEPFFILFNWASLLSVWDWLDLTGLTAVLAGVIGETWSSKKHNEYWEHFWGKIVIFGLAIEISVFPHHIHETGELNREAADAREIASKSEKEAGQANERAAKFERQSADLFKIGEEAKESATNAQVQLEKSKIELEKAESGRLELEKQVLALVKKTNVRTISKKTKEDLILNLKWAPKGNVEIVVFDENAEGIAFGLEIKKALTDAGLQVTLSPRSIFRAVEMFPNIIESGTDLIFCVKNTFAPPLCSEIVFWCFNNDGIKAQGWPYNDTLGTNDFQIWICPKPT